MSPEMKKLDKDFDAEEFFAQRRGFEAETLPVIYEVIKVNTYRDEEVVLEVFEHRQPNICRCIAITSTFGLKRNSSCIATGEPLSVPIGENLYGRIINVLGNPVEIPLTD